MIVKFMLAIAIQEKDNLIIGGKVAQKNKVVIYKTHPAGSHLNICFILVEHLNTI